MSQFSNKTICVVDSGQFVELARRLSRDFGRVLYHSPWQMSSPRLNFTCVGDGMEEIQRVNYLFEVIDKVDLFIFPSLFFWDVQLHLEKLGKRVWGSRKGESIELRRDTFKETIREAGLRIVPHEQIVGLQALEQYLEEHDDVWIKVDANLRGDTETWNSKNKLLSRWKLARLKTQWGPRADSIPFVVEKAITKATEAGYDGYNVDGHFPDHGLETLEIKDCGTVAHYKPSQSMSAAVRKVNEALAPFFSRNRYRNYWGTEIRVVSPEEFYFTDATCRQACPPGELYQEMFENLAEIFWYGAEGILVQPNCRWNYGIQCMVYSPASKDDWESFEVEKDAENLVKVAYASGAGDGKRHVPPDAVLLPEPDVIIGSVIGMGNSVIEAVKAVARNAKKFKTYHAEVKLSAIPDAFNALEEGKRRGVRWTMDPLPTADELRRALA